MTTAFNPLNHPAILRTPARFNANGGEVAHLPFLFFLLSVLRPRLLVELGTGEGDSYCALCQAVLEEGLPTRCLASTVWSEATVLAQLRAYHDQRYNGFSRLLPTASNSAFEAALSQCPDGAVDLLHLVNASAAVWETWLPKLSSRSVVVFSNIDAKPETKHWWSELKSHYPHFEFTHSGGLVLLAVGESCPPELAALLTLPAKEAAQVREFFERLSRFLLTDNPLRPAFERHVAEQRGILQTLRAQVAAHEQREERLQMQLAQRERALDQLTAEYAEITRSGAWRFIQLYLAARRRLLPPGSRQERGLKEGARLLRILGQFGVKGTAYKVLARLRRRLGRLDADSYVDRQTLKQIYTRPPIALPELHLPKLETAAEQAQPLPGATVSVIIPTLNAGAEFALLLASLLAQRGCEALELILVDSGSADDTVALAQSYGARVIQLPPAEFTHAHARNLGAQAAQGKYLLFMVQDALPGSPLWIAGLVEALLRYHAVAVSSVEAPREDADLLACQLNQAHYQFLGATEEDRVLQWPATPSYAEVRRNAQLCNVACLIERAVFLRYGLRGAYAEDLDLGLRLIQDGYKLALLNSVKVVHSHNRPAFYHLKRSYVDNTTLAELFDDFPKAPTVPLARLAHESVAVAHVLARLFARAQANITKLILLEEFAVSLRQEMDALYEQPSTVAAQPLVAEPDDYQAFLARLANCATSSELQLRDSEFAAAMRQMLVYTLATLQQTHKLMEPTLLESLRDCLYKAHALELGRFLASTLTAEQAAAAWIDRELRKGV